MLYHLFSNAEILQRLRAGLATTAGASTASSSSSSEDVLLELKRLEQLPYLTSIIMEGKPTCLDKSEEGCNVLVNKSQYETNINRLEHC